MKKKSLLFGEGFKVVLGNRRVQAAQMSIRPAGSEGALKIGTVNPINGSSFLPGVASPSLVGAVIR